METADDKTFRINFTEEGVSNLRETVRDKLKEFMGDYTDDTLVEYVIVLLRNGRSKEEAKSELDVFLGDDSDSFVSWLWDHLDANLNLYVQASDVYTDGVTMSVGDEQQDGKHVENLPKRQHKRAWNTLESGGIKPKPLKSFVVANAHLEERSTAGGAQLGGQTHHRDGRGKSPPPERHLQRKRSRLDEPQQAKRDVVLQANVDAPRRLLQFAVRDAVATLKPPGLVREPSVKRLRSVVSTSTGDTPLVDNTRRLQSTARLLNPMPAVVKAVKEAVEDAQKVKSARSVFDRLSRNDVADASEQVEDFTYGSVEDEEHAGFQLTQDQTCSVHGKNTSMLGRRNGLVSNSLAENEGYHNVEMVGEDSKGVFPTGASSGNKYEDPSMVQYSVAKYAGDAMHRARNNEHAQTLSNVNFSHKKLRAPVNIDTSKLSPYPGVKVAELKIQKPARSMADAGKPDVRLMKENKSVDIGNGNVHSASQIQKDSLKTSVTGSFSAGRPLEDADSRTIFVSNVHFAATKDSLSRHFNKFGEVLKVTINTDAATGQPIGSAYVEFMRKGAADNAISLDGTSFMSRILKVAKRSLVNLEANPTMTWPRAARGSPYAPARLSRVPFPRGVPGAMRRGLSRKPGARSMQWKRDNQSSSELGTSVTGSNVVTQTARSLTYVRAEPKPNGHPNAT